MVPTSATVAEAPATFLTAREAANLCRCSVRTVRRRMGDGTWREGTHFHRPGGAEPRFERAALLAWLQTPPEEDATAPMGLAYGTDIPAPVRRRRLHLWPNKM